MKKITLLFAAVSAFAFSTASAQYNVSITSSAGGAFATTQNTQFNQSVIGTQADAFLTDSTLFQTATNANFGELAVYKAGIGNGWADSSNAQTFTLNVVGTPTSHDGSAGPRWRHQRTLANGSQVQFGGWSNLTEGSNSISMTGGVAFNRMVGFQIAGIVNFDTFTHSTGGLSDTLSVTAAAVPEVSHFGLLTGVVVLAFAARRRRA